MADLIRFNNPYANAWVATQTPSQGLSNVYMTSEVVGRLQRIELNHEVVLHFAYLGVEVLYWEKEALRQPHIPGQKPSPIRGKSFPIGAETALINPGQSVSMYVEWTPSSPEDQLCGELWGESWCEPRLPTTLHPQPHEGPLQNHFAPPETCLCPAPHRPFPMRSRMQRVVRVTHMAFSREVIVHRVFLGIEELWAQGECFAPKGERAAPAPWRGTQLHLEQGSQRLLSPGMSVVALVEDPTETGQPLTMEIWGRGISF